MESEAPPSAALYNFLGWLNANKKRVGLSIGLIAVVIAVLVFTQWQKGQREIYAAEELSTIRLPLNAGELAAPDTAEKLIKLAETYPKTRAAEHARMLAGSTLFASGEYAKAQAQFEKFLAEQEESPWIAQARYGIATCLDGLNKTNEAIAQYDAFIKSHPNEPVTEHAKLNAGRLQEQSGKLAEAVARYDGMVKEAFAKKNQAAYTQAIMDAQERVREIYSKNPQLAFPKMIPPSTNTVVLPPVIKTNLPPATNAAVKTNPPMLILTNLPPKP